MSDFRHGDQTQTAAELQAEWDNNPRWAGIKRDYTAEDVIKLRGPVREERTLAKRGAQKLWDLIQENDDPNEWISALGALTGNPGSSADQSRTEGHLSFRLAGCSGCKPFRSDIS